MEKFKLIEGFNPKCSNDQYHGDMEYRSSSALKMMLKDPRQFYKTYVLNEPQNFNSDALSIGSFIHTRILEPHLVDEEYAIYTGSRRSGEVWKKFKEEAGNKIIITSSQKQLTDQMIDNFNKASVKLGNHGNEKEVLISSFFNGGAAEETLAGTLNGYKVKTRFDYRKEFDDFGSINDLKTTGIALGSATLEDVEDICTYWGYDLSAALYVDLVSQATGKPHDFYFVFISKKDFQTRIFKASDGMLERGRAMYREAIEKLKEAEKSGVYFENKIQELR
jgi:exodeoxyribonuclease VIII